MVFHNDLPTTDFTSLFKTVQGDGGYTNPTEEGKPSNMFAFASGKSFFHQILPANFVHSGFTFHATHYLSRWPVEKKSRYLFGVHSDAEVDEIVHKQGLADMRAFWESRSKELVSGGVFLYGNVHAKGLREGFGTAVYESITRAHRRLVEEGVLNENEFNSFVFPVYILTREEVVDCLPSSLKLVSERGHSTTHTLYQNYLQTKDAQLFSEMMTAWINSFEPINVQWLKDNGKTQSEIDSILLKLVARMKDVLREDPDIWNVTSNHTAMLFRKD